MPLNIVELLTLVT